MRGDDDDEEGEEAWQGRVACGPVKLPFSLSSASDLIAALGRLPRGVVPQQGVWHPIEAGQGCTHGLLVDPPTNVITWMPTPPGQPVLVLGCFYVDLCV